MITKKLDTTKENIEIAAQIIRSGGLVAFPTETVYGLGADALNETATGKIYAAKGRPSDNPMIVHISDIKELELLAEEVSSTAKTLMEAFWPGPITFVLKKKENVPSITTGGLNTVAVRMPSDEIARELIKKSKTPIAAPSANLSGKPSPTTAMDVLEDMDGRIDAVIMGEPCLVGIESTVLDLTSDIPVILRPGYITKEDIDKVIEVKTEFDGSLFMKPSNEEFKPKSPGMKYKHYAPKAEFKIITGNIKGISKAIEELKEKAENEGNKVEVLYYGEDSEKAAKTFFADLRRLDRDGVDLIIAASLKPEGLGFSVMNRMMKSAGYDIIYVEEEKDDSIS
ncbi:MAG: threonylcarbamoyl-AMP synthase [Peptostreptococcaceae bacterium]|nr:threonylcarbamoyl-AMP synthase [Peptostreptococcaceae bacterium]